MGMAELSGFEVLALLKEVSAALRGTYINGIYSFGNSQLLRLRRADSPDVWLVISPRKGVWVSGKVSERAETTDFTSRLRGELERLRFTAATQVDLDRVFQLGFGGGEEERRLIVELMPPGNIIVTDASGKILIVQEEVRTPARRVVVGEEYRPPKQSRASPLEVTAADVGKMLEGERTAGRAVGRHIALPRKYVAESLSRLGLGEDSPASALKGREEEVVRVLRGMVDEARLNPRPTLYGTDAGEEVYVLPPTHAQESVSAQTVSEICDKLFLNEVGEESLEAPSPEEARRRELQITIKKLREETSSLSDRAARTRAAAASASTAEIGEALGILREAGGKLAREPSSPSAVASALFDRAKELEKQASDSAEAAAKLERRLERIRPGETRKPKPLPRRTREWYEKFRWFITSGGKLAVGGRDAQSNALLVRRHLSEGDVVYHADLFGSPFFVLKEGRSQSEDEVAEMAQATVSFSSGWKTGLGAADAYWVNPDQVSSSAESGEYLARGSFVIRGRKNFVKHALVQVAVGVDEKGRIVAGPEIAVGKACPSYVVLVPHREKASDTAKRVLKDLSEPGGGAPAPSVDDIVRALPSGGGKIVRRRARASSSG